MKGHRYTVASARLETRHTH